MPAAHASVTPAAHASVTPAAHISVIAAAHTSVTPAAHISVIAALRRGNLAECSTDVCTRLGEIPAASAGMTERARV